MTAANVIAIDPGYSARGEGCACAHTIDGVLRHAWSTRPPCTVGHGLITGPLVVIVEKPQQDSRSWGLPPSTLINLAWEGALLAGLYAGRFGGSVVAVTPSTWKGSVSKPVAHGRLWEVLTPAEREVLGGDDTARRIEAAKRKGALDRWGKPGVRYYPRTWGGHNLLDAAALALTHVGRLTK